MSKKLTAVRYNGLPIEVTILDDLSAVAAELGVEYKVDSKLIQIAGLDVIGGDV